MSTETLIYVGTAEPLIDDSLRWRITLAEDASPEDLKDVLHELHAHHVARDETGREIDFSAPLNTSEQELEQKLAGVIAGSPQLIAQAR